MKRLASSVISLLVSVSLALPPSTYAITDTSAASSAQQNNSVDSQQLTNVLSGFFFAGQLVSWFRIMNMARDPVVDWGPAQDEQGNVLQGELWMIVLRNEKFIYFHLTDTPNSAQDTTSYGGYTVKIKAPMTIEFYGIGSGGLVPVIGNDTDTFLVTTTEMLINSKFVEGEVRRFDIRTGAEIPYLVHLYDEVYSYGIASVGSRIALAIQYFSPDGTELSEPFQQTYYRSATSTYSATCNDAGKTASDTIHAIADAGEVTTTFVFKPGLVLSQPIVGGSLGVGALAYGNIGALIGSVGGRVGRSLARNIVAPIAGALAEGICESLTNPDVLPPIEVVFNSPDLDTLVSDVVLVCDAITSEYVGSSGTVDDNGDVTVIGHTENVCSEWHYEVVS